MKTNIFIIVLALFIFSACADDYLDARGPVPLDGPGTFINAVGDEIISTDDDGDTFTFVPNGGTARIEISVVDAPGLIDSVNASLSNIQRPDDWGTITFEGFEAVQGQTSGTFFVVYQAPLLDENSEFSVAEESMVVTVADSQGTPKTVNLSLANFKTQLSQGSDCFANIDLVGFYDAVSSGFDSEAGDNYSELEAEIEIYLLKSRNNNPGWIRISDGSFGLYGLQGFAGNFINIEVCGNQVVNADEEFEDSFTGSINDDTGVITINWSNEFGDTGTTVLTPQ